MFLRSFRIQLSFLFRQRITQLVMLFLFLLVGFNYIVNILIFQGEDVVNLFHPMKILLLSYNRGYFNGDLLSFFIQLYPLLVALPAGTILTREKKLGIDVMITSRIGHFDYIMGKMVACFAATTIVFSVPFLFEIVLNSIVFPSNAVGDMLMYWLFDPKYIQAVNNYLIPGLYLKSPYLYAVIHTILFGFFSGILGTFALSLSSVIRFHYRILCILPSFLILEGIEYYRMIHFPTDYIYAWWNYFFLFSEHEKNLVGFIAIVFALTATMVILAFWGSRRDCI